MILAFSTSSPQASVALLEPDGSLIAARAKLAPMAASGASLTMVQGLLAELGRGLGEVTGTLADLGPGSFTGVRVGVTLAKTIAMLLDVSCAGASSFDLVDPTRAVAVPSKKSEYFVREPGQEPVRLTEPGEVIGYGAAFTDPHYPEAANFGLLIGSVVWVRPEELVPRYLIEPSISQPKTPFPEAVR